MLCFLRKIPRQLSITLFYCLAINIVHRKKQQQQQILDIFCNCNLIDMISNKENKQKLDAHRERERTKKKAIKPHLMKTLTIYFTLNKRAFCLF